MKQITNNQNTFVDGFRVLNPKDLIRDWKISRRKSGGIGNPGSWGRYYLPETPDEAWDTLTSHNALVVTFDTAKIHGTARTIWMRLDVELGWPGALVSPQMSVRSHVDFLGLSGRKTSYLGDWLFFDGGKTHHWVESMNRQDQLTQIVLRPDWALAWAKEKPEVLVELKKLYLSGFDSRESTLSL